ncbi:MAG TPA: methyltransferase [Polyangiaceae bacterium]
MRVARKRIFERIHGFYDVKVIAAAIRTGLTDLLLAGTGDVATLAAKSSLQERGVEALLIGLQALGLVTHHRDGYAVTDVGSALFDTSSEMYIGDLVQFVEWQSDALPRLLDTLKTDRPCWEGFGHYIEGAKEATSTDVNQERFNRALDAGARSTAQAVLRLRDFSHVKSLLDVGGNLGGFASVFLQAFPDLKATVFDLPQVASQLGAIHANEPYAKRLAAVGGDFTRDKLPRGHDLITYIRIFNSRTDELCVSLLKNAYEALRPGGECLFYDEHVLADDYANVDTAMLWGAMFMLISSPGRIRTVSQWKTLFERAGFTQVEAAVQKHYGAVWGKKP